MLARACGRTFAENFCPGKRLASRSVSALGELMYLGFTVVVSIVSLRLERKRSHGGGVRASERASGGRGRLKDTGT